MFLPCSYYIYGLGMIELEYKDSFSLRNVTFKIVPFFKIHYLFVNQSINQSINQSDIFSKSSVNIPTRFASSWELNPGPFAPKQEFHAKLSLYTHFSFSLNRIGNFFSVQATTMRLRPHFLESWVSIAKDPKQHNRLLHKPRLIHQRLYFSTFQH